MGNEGPTTSGTSRRGLTVIKTVCVDDDAVAQGTFQSHNQKVVQNRNGIFMTHIRSRSDPYIAQQWRLSRSTDGGQTFATIHEATDPTNPPAMETDERNNLYLVRPDFVDKNAYLYRFLADEGYETPRISKIENASAGKYCMTFDREREQLYYLAHNGTFHVVGLDGEVRRSCVLLQRGQDAILQYPHLCLDRDGILHVAWTSLLQLEPRGRGNYIYRDIQYMQSRDGGETWQSMDGTRLTPPVVADRFGPTDRITPDEELDLHTWLAGFMSKDGKVHFVYHAHSEETRRRQMGANGGVQHYIRYDLETARRDIDVSPEFRGQQISLYNVDGFFVSQSEIPGSPLYCVMADGTHVACLASKDNGESWCDYAVSDREFVSGGRGKPIYAVGGSREVSEDGHVIGSFTHRLWDPDDPAADDRFKKAHVYFIKFEAGLSAE